VVGDPRSGGLPDAEKGLIIDVLRIPSNCRNFPNAKKKS